MIGARDRAIDALTLAILAACVAAHVRFVALDERLPRDLNLAYPDLTRAWLAWARPDVPTGGLLDVATRPGGWYQALLAVWMGVAGRSAGAFRAVDVLAVAVVLVGSTFVARRLGGPRAGAATAALLGATPLLVYLGRLSWIHVPEAALVTLALAVWVADPALTRGRSIAAIAVTGGLAFALRPSAAVWLLPLAAAIGLGQARLDRRWAAIAVGWGLGVVVQLPTLSDYFAYKMHARTRYLAFLPSLGEHLLLLVGPLPGLLGLTGLALGWRFAGPLPAGLTARPGRLGPLGALWGAWLTLPLVVQALTGAGLDNFPLVAVALAIPAGVGFGAVSPRWLAVPVAAFAVLHGAQYVPVHGAPVPALRALGLQLQRPDGEAVEIPFLPARGFGAAGADALLRATCGAQLERPGACTILVDQGFFFPNAEEPGALELLLMHRENVGLHGLMAHTDLRGDTPDALVSFDCGADDARWRDRFPDSVGALQALVPAHDLRIVWRYAFSPRCQLRWATPGGRLVDEAAMPPFGTVLPPAARLPQPLPPPRPRG